MYSPVNAGAEVVRQIAPHECRAIRLVAAHPERLAVGVVHRGIERARDHERAQLRDGRRKASRARDRLGGAEILRLEHAEQIDRVPGRITGRRDATDLGGKRDHGAEPGLLRRRGERPRVAQRHGPEAPAFPVLACPDAAIHVQDGHAIDGSSAELVGGPVLVRVVRMVDVDNAYVGRAHEPQGGAGRAARDRQGRRDAQMAEQCPARELGGREATHGG